MDAEELTAMTAAVHACFGREATIYVYPAQAKTTLNLLQRLLFSEFGQEYLLFVVEKGPAEIFCLSGLRRSPVVMSDRYLDLFYRLRTVFGPEFDPRTGQQLFFESLLSAIAELALSHGREEFAIAMFLKSAQNKKVFLTPGPTISEIGTNPINEFGVVSLFFGLVHEIGHAYFAAEVQKTPSYPVDMEAAFTPEVETLISTDFNSTDEVKDEYRKLAQKVGSVLSPRALGEEVWVDSFATRVICFAASRLMSFTGTTTFDKFSLAVEIMTASRLISTIEFGRVVAELSNEGEVSYRTFMEKWNVYSMAFSYRNEHIGSTLIEALACLEDQLHPEACYERITDKMAGLSHQLMFKLGPIDGCIMSVADIASDASKPGAWKQLLSELPSEPVVRDMVFSEARTFLRIADTVGASGEALSALRNLVKSS